MEKVQEKVDFIIGREIEVGGVYKGVVTSVKEYGAFVEFNGGQQGLLHISELSHEPVSRVSDVVSVGQQLSLMCIGRDVRGNIKLSLKSTLTGARSKKEDSIGKSTPTSQSSNIWVPIGEVCKDQEKQDASARDELLESNETAEQSSAPETPAFLIRSAAECDEEERTTGVDLSSKTSNTSRTPKPDEKSKALLEHTDIDSSPKLDLSSRNVKKFKKGNKSIADLVSDYEGEDKSTSKAPRQSKSDLNKDSTVETAIKANKLKLGMKLVAKVHQIRALGLVLDLGGGLRGMYRFEAGTKRDFEVGDQVLVKCTSFSSKGVPVMSLVEDK
nr:polyribonucleotide nucleotidyltransferase 2, mitochondrial [Ipomoea batatas]